ncbi:type IV secretory system conjugative DNA transfer family protein [Nocardia mexicana]|uniref:Type IV secretion system coupling TraD/TrwB family protein n=1 Tax=Nocardia mexicana TaxID=279262 RepID=A0A370HAQ9_9NOCA|nr:type IV secretory system conjugative DNA transfer family protein [Nocardia mexicana]RDI54019.1 hypothetical protein DFR68_102140 [Nocardia mexicana]
MVRNDQLELPLGPDSVVWQQIWFPRPFPEAIALGVLRQWASEAHAPQLILEARSSTKGVDYLIGSQLRYAKTVQRTIEHLVPGSQVSQQPGDRGPVSIARRVQPSSRVGYIEPEDAVASTRSILLALMAVSGSEQLVLQLELGARRRPQALPVELPHQQQSVLSKVLEGIQPETRTEVKQALGKKLGQHGFEVTVRIGADAATSDRRRILLLSLASALGTVNAVGVHLELRADDPRRINTPRSRSSWALWPLVARGRHLAASEALWLTAWPVSDREEIFPGQGSLHPRKLRPTPALSTGERIVAQANAPGADRLIAYDTTDACQHTWIIGRTGVGKTEFIRSLIRQDWEAGRPVACIEPKDLVESALRCVPDSQKDNIVVLDPLDDFPVGINVLDRLQTPDNPSGTPPEIVADQLYHIFHTLYGNALGYRSGDILRESLKAIALAENPSLIMLPMILTNPTFRRPLVKRAIERDPVASRNFWMDWFEKLSPEGVMNHIAPLSNKVRPFLDRYMRGVLAQRHPRFNIRQVLAEGKSLMIPLQPGILGPERAQLMAAVLMSELWNAIQERANTPAHQLRPLMVYVDEVEMFLNLPVKLDDALATARSLKAGFHLAHQYGTQLPPTMLKAFQNNARNKVCFNLGVDDAKAMAAGQTVLTPEDFTSLPAHHVLVQLMRQNSVQPWTSGITLPPIEESGDSTKLSDPDDIRARSRARYGRPRAEVEAEFMELLEATARAKERQTGHPGVHGRRHQRRRQP